MFQKSKIFYTFADASAKTPNNPSVRTGTRFFQRVKIVKKV